MGRLDRHKGRCYLCGEEVDAARSADKQAERVAEKERNYQYDHLCRQCWDHFEETLETHNNEPICQECIDKLDKEE